MATPNIRIIGTDILPDGRVIFNGEITLVGLAADGTHTAFTHPRIHIDTSGTDTDKLGKYGTLAIAADGTWVYQFNGQTFTGALATMIVDNYIYGFYLFNVNNYFLYGTRGDNLLWGSQTNDVIYGGAGNDELQGFRGRDVLIGGEGDDMLIGGGGRDYLFGGEGNDRLYGGEYSFDGSDVLSGGDGIDFLYGGEGGDSLSGGNDNDFLYGGDGHDLMEGDGGHDTLSGESGDDSLNGGSGRDYLVGGIGNDIIEGGEGQDTAYWDGTEGSVKVNLGDTVRWKFDTSTSRWIDGTTADYTYIRAWIDTNNNGFLDASDEFDYLKDIESLAVSGGNNNILTGDAQNNHFWLGGRPGLNIIDGGDGYDTVQLDILGRARVNLADSTKWKFNLATNSWISGTGAEYEYIRAEIDWNGDGYFDSATDYSYFKNIEKLIGYDQQGILKGSAGPNHLKGHGGTDWLYGGAANDWLEGGGGKDWLYGEEGDDKLYGGSGNDRLHGGKDNDRLYGDYGKDWLHGGEGHDRLSGGAGIDVLYGNGDKDWLWGDAGNDSLHGGEGRDHLWGGDDNDWLYGEEGDDHLGGSDGNDFLFGGVGNDWLWGGDGNDVLYGGTGVDYLIGANRLRFNRGDDIFVLYQGVHAEGSENLDIVWEFGWGQHKIRVATETGSETTLKALKAAANLRWTTDTNESRYGMIGDNGEVGDINDTVIWDTRGTADTSDDIRLMMLEDYTEDLTIDNFDIVRATPAPTPPTPPPPTAPAPPSPPPTPPPAVDVAPTAMTLSATTGLVQEGVTGPAIKLAEVSFTDDGRGTNEITIPESAIFEVRNGNELWLKADAVFDYETAQSHSITLTPSVTGTGTPPAAQTFTLNVVDGDDAPTAMTLSTATGLVQEGVTGSAVKLAEVSFTDDGRGTNEVTIPESAIFEVRNGNELWLKADAVFDYETAQSHSITLTPSVTGTGTAPAAQTFTLNVVDMDDAPILVILTLNQMPVNEGLTEAQKLAEVNFIDDALGTNSMTIPDSELFEIRNGRELWLKEDVMLDYETARSHSIRFTINTTGTGGVAPFTGVYTLTVRDMEEFAIRTIMFDGQLHTHEDSSLLVSAGQMRVESPWPVGTDCTLYVDGVRVRANGSFIAGDYGRLEVNQDGSWQYALDDSHAAVEALHGRVGEAGNRLTETFTVTFVKANSETATRSFTITIEGRTDHYMATDERVLNFRGATENLTLHSHNQGGVKDLYGGAGHDVLYGGSGTDNLFGGGGNDVLYAKDYHDRLFGEAGDDELNGGSGNDYLNGGSGNDILNGVEGTQDAASWVDTSREVNVKVNLGDTVKWKFDAQSRTWISGTTADYTYVRAWVDLDQDGLLEETDEFDYLVNIEQLYGSSGDDTFTGSGRDEVFYDEFGGSDRFDGGGGQDAVIWKGVTGSIIADLSSDAKWKYVTDSNSWVSGTGAGYDYIRVSIHRDTENELPEYDYLKSIERLAGDSGADRLTGDARANHLLGLGGRDILVGGAGNDWLDGGKGHDVLEGGTGVDMLNGGRGNDIFVLYQGAHAEESNNLDLVIDFALGQNKIRVATATGLETTLAALQAAANLRWTTNTDESELTGDDFNLPYINDVVIWDTKGTADTSDDIRLMILQDYTEDLTIENFDIVRAPTPPTPPPAASNIRIIGNNGRVTLNGDITLVGLAADGTHAAFARPRIDIDTSETDADKLGQYGTLAIAADGTWVYQFNELTFSGDLVTMISDSVTVLRSDWPSTTYFYGYSGDEHLFAREGGDVISGGAGKDYLGGYYRSNDIFVLYQGTHAEGSDNIDIVTNFRSADKIRVATATGSETTLTALKTVANLRWTNDTDESQSYHSIYYHNAPNIHDTVIWDTRGTADTSDDIKLMILVDYCWDLTIADFDIVRTPPPAIDGGGGNDFLYGTRASEWLQGSVGHDVLYGGAGSDRLEGGSGRDMLVGGEGKDELSGDGGSDFLFGGTGDDDLYGGAGYDWLSGGAGVDFLYGNEGNDRLLGGEGNDRLLGGNGKDELYGGEGNDELWGEAGRDTLVGGAGSDELWGGSGDDVLYGDDDSDFLYGGDGSDVLYGGESGDHLHGEDGKDILYGGGSRDWLTGGNGNDKLYGGAGNDALEGDAGVDFLYGGTGRDVLDGGMGSDELYGGAGNDRLYGNIRNDRLGEANTDVLSGGTGRDTLFGSWSNDIFVLYQGVHAKGSDNLDVVRHFAGNKDKIRVTTETGSETTLEALKAVANLRWTTNTNEVGAKRDKAILDTVIWDTRGTTSTSDDIKLMILEDYTTDLTIENFDIV